MASPSEPEHEAVRLQLGQMTTEEFARAARGALPFVVLLPVGSVEPHGPHLPLETDTLISLAACERAALMLRQLAVVACIAPALPYGVTDFAAGFAGAISLPATVLSSVLGAIVDGYLGHGARHVCIVNNHLEPAQDAAVRASIGHAAPGRASVACPLTRRWARTLSDEFKSGACHAGRYETSLVLATTPALVRAEREELLAVPISLSEGIKSGKTTFTQMGMSQAYAGSPADASAEEGAEQLGRLFAMIVGEVMEALDVR